MESKRFAEFWQALRESLGGHTEWSRRVTTAGPRGQGEYVVMLHILAPSPSQSQESGNGSGGGDGHVGGGRLAVLGGERAAGGQQGHHGLWTLDIDARTLADFEEEVLVYEKVSDFAQELSQALLEQDTTPSSSQPGGGSQPKHKQQHGGPPTVRVVPPAGGQGAGPLKVEVDFRAHDCSATFTLRPLQTQMAPEVLPALLPFFHLDRRGFGRHPLPLPPSEEAEGEEDGAGGKKGAAATSKAGGQKRQKRKKGEIFD